MATRYNSDSCGALIENYNVVPGSSFGALEPFTELKKVYDDFDCNTRVCTYFRDKYGATGGGNYGTLPVRWRYSWDVFGCEPIAASELL
ncbi:hypothetical protein PLESTM_000783500 [Pleodorina starrii]|nr:hypothetical protein PLESTM_000783500 [Pleodorina starrii]